MEAIFVLVMLMAIVGAVPLLMLAAYYAQTPCPGCERRGTVGWLNAKKNGGPDLRYGTNYRVCRACGWTSIDAKLAEIQADFQQRLDRIRAAAEAECAQEAAESAERGVVWLLKFIALADRRFADGERQAIEEQIRRLFPRERHAKLMSWAAELKADSSADLNTHLSNFAALPSDDRAGLYRDLEAMATADGKATKAEKDRLKQIHGALGLS